MDIIEEYVYTFYNKETHKHYIGKTDRGEWRIHDHFKLLRNNRHYIEDMQKDYNLYGKDSFDYLLIPFPYKLYGTYIEGKTMLLLQSYKREYGYNYKDQYVRKKDGNATQNVIRYENLNQDKVETIRELTEFVIFKSQFEKTYINLINLTKIFIEGGGVSERNSTNMQCTS